MKQASMFGDEFTPAEEQYTSKIDAPVYSPKNKQPHILELCDRSKSERLIN